MTIFLATLMANDSDKTQNGALIPLSIHSKLQKMGCEGGRPPLGLERSPKTLLELSTEFRETVSSNLLYFYVNIY